MLKKILFAVSALLMAAVLFTGCGKNEELLSKIKKEGKFIVYTNPNFPPYEYLGEGGKISGVEMDLVEMIAKKLGVKAEFVAAEFDSILMTVVTGKADMGASGFTINEERKKKVDFSIPFEVSTQYMIIPKGSSIKCVEDLAGKKIGCQQGTTGFLMVQDAVNKGVLKDTKTIVQAYNYAPDAVLAMQQGKVDAVVIDKLVAVSLARANGNLPYFAVVKKDGNLLGASEEFGIMLAKGNEKFMAVINEVIAQAKADGTLKALLEKHSAITEKKKDGK